MLLFPTPFHSVFTYLKSRISVNLLLTKLSNALNANVTSLTLLLDLRNIRKVKED